jgi:hypothetical protein
LGAVFSRSCVASGAFIDPDHVIYRLFLPAKTDEQIFIEKNLHKESYTFTGGFGYREVRIWSNFGGTSDS